MAPIFLKGFSPFQPYPASSGTTELLQKLPEGGGCIKNVTYIHTNPTNIGLNRIYRITVSLDRIYSINRPGHLLNIWTLRVGAYSRLGAYWNFTIFRKCSMFILVSVKYSDENSVFGKFSYLDLFNFILIVTQVNKWILWCCLLDVGYRNVGKSVSRPKSRYSLFAFEWEGQGVGLGGPLLTFSAFRMAAYSRWALIWG